MAANATLQSAAVAKEVAALAALLQSAAGFAGSNRVNNDQRGRIGELIRKVTELAPKLLERPEAQLLMKLVAKPNAPQMPADDDLGTGVPDTNAMLSNGTPAQASRAPLPEYDDVGTGAPDTNMMRSDGTPEPDSHRPLPEYDDF
jgi:hypothetical protein